MAKDTEQKLAKSYYINEQLTPDEIAEKCRVNRKTVDRWIKDGNWKKIRDAKETSGDQLMINLKELLSLLVEQRIELQKGGADPKDKVAISDEISKASKALEAAKKEGRPTLSTYIWCIESFMDDLLREAPEKHHNLIDFQEQHVLKMAQILE